MDERKIRLTQKKPGHFSLECTKEQFVYIITHSNALQRHSF
jgi:hypothetical protein